MTKSEYLAKMKEWQAEKLRLLQNKESRTNEDGSPKTHREDFLAEKRGFDNRQKRDAALRLLLNSLTEEQQTQLCQKLGLPLNEKVVGSLWKIVNDYHVESKIQVKISGMTTDRYPDRFLEVTEAVLEMINDESLLDKAIEAGEYKANLSYDTEKSTEYLVQEGIMEEVLESLEKSDMAPDEKELFLRELERTNSIVRGDTEEHSNSKTSYANHLSDAISSDYHEEMKELLSTPEYAQLGEILKPSDSKMNGGAMLMQLIPDKMEHKEAYKNFAEQRFKFSDDTVQRVKSVINKMKELDLIPDKYIAAEQGTKIYAFETTSEALNQITDAARALDTKALREATERYSRELDKMRELYAFSAELVGTDEKNFPGNVDNNRTRFVPPEFKGNQQVNSMLNGIYLTAIYLRNHNIDLDTYLNDPFAVNYDAVNKEGARISEEVNYEGKTLGAALASFSKIDEQAYDPVGFSMSMLRPLEVMYNMEKDKTARALACAGSIFLEKHSLTLLLQKNLPAYFFDRYARKETMTNLFLVPGSESQIDHYLGEETEDVVNVEKIPAFDTKAYVATHDISPQELFDRIVNTFEDYIKEGGDGKHLTQMATSAREAAMLAKTLKAYPKDTPGLRDLNNFILAPSTTLIRAMGDRINMPYIHTVRKNPLDSLSPKAIKNAAREKNREVRQLRKEEKKVNKQLDKLNKNISKLQKAADKAENGSAKRQEKLDRIAANKEAISKLTNEAISNLKTSFENGKVPSVYFEQRTRSLEAGDYKKQNAMFVEGLTDKKSFLAAQKEQGIDEKTAKEKYKELTGLEKQGLAQYGARAAVGIPETQVYEIKHAEAVKLNEPKLVVETPKRRNLSPDELNISRAKQRETAVEAPSPAKQIDEVSVGDK